MRAQDQLCKHRKASLVFFVLHEEQTRASYSNLVSKLYERCLPSGKKNKLPDLDKIGKEEKKG